MTLRRIAAVAAAAAAIVTVPPTLAAARPPAESPTQLAAQVQRLQTAAEVATERYDGVEARLQQTVAEQSLAAQAAARLRPAAVAARNALAAQATALYESGGSLGIWAELLTGRDPADSLSRYRFVGDALAYQRRATAAALAQVDRAKSAERTAAAATAAVTQLEVQARGLQSQVRERLAAARQALRSATAEVRRQAQAAQAAAAAASAQAFQQAVARAGGSLTDVPATSPVAAAAIAAARSRLGLPYVWGATGPKSFDCSGLTQWAYAHAGVTLPRVAADQWNAGPHPSLAALLPGDLLFWATDTSDPATIHHVAIYLGGGQMIAAPHTGADVSIQPVYLSGLIGATRPWLPAGADSTS